MHGPATSRSDAVVSDPTSVVSDAVIDHLSEDPIRHERVGFERVRFVGLSGMRGRIKFEACAFVDCEFVDCDLDTGFAGALAHPESASTLRRVRFVRCRLGKTYLGGV